MVSSCIDSENSKKKYINENKLKFLPWMTSLNLPQYRTFLVVSNMRVSVLIKAVIRSDGFSWHQQLLSPWGFSKVQGQGNGGETDTLVDWRWGGALSSLPWGPEFGGWLQKVKTPELPHPPDDSPLDKVEHIFFNSKMFNWIIKQNTGGFGRCVVWFVTIGYA